MSICSIISLTQMSTCSIISLIGYMSSPWQPFLVDFPKWCVKWSHGFSWIHIIISCRWPRTYGRFYFLIRTEFENDWLPQFLTMCRIERHLGLGTFIPILFPICVSFLFSSYSWPRNELVMGDWCSFCFFLSHKQSSRYIYLRIFLWIIKKTYNINFYSPIIKLVNRI